MSDKQKTQQEFANVVQQVAQFVQSLEVEHAAKTAIEANKAPDMVTGKVFERALFLLSRAGVTRTWVFGSLVYGGAFGALTGLDESQAVELVRALYKAIQANPKAAELKAAYEKANLSAAAAKAADGPTLDPNGGIIAPDNGKVH